VVIGTNCIGSYKSNYHTTTTTTALFLVIKNNYSYTKVHLDMTSNEALSDVKEECSVLYNS